MFRWAAAAWAQDLDADGVPDDVDTCPSLANPTQALVLAGPDALPPLFEAGFAGLVAVDLDGDRDLDLAAAAEPVGAEQGLGVFLQQADGTFRATWHDGAPWSGFPRGVHAGDLDGDGDVDLAGRDGSLWRNDGGGALAIVGDTALPADLEVADSALADLDRDGLPDLVLATWTFEYDHGFEASEGQVSWQRNQGRFRFAAPAPLAADAGGLGNSAVLAADVDGDGDPDVVHADADLGRFAWLELDGGALVRAHDVGAGAVPSRLDAADLDADGDLDLVGSTCRDGRLSWYERRADRFVERRVASGLACPRAVRAADLDADGVLDLVLAGDSGTAWFAGPDFPAATLDPEPAGAVVVADLDGSGTPDLVSGGHAADVLLRWSGAQPPDRDADGRCDPDDPCPLDPSAPAGGACADADGDGLSDLDEARLGTDADLVDTDGDGLSDLDEALGRTAPTEADTDGDGAEDGADPCPVEPDPDGDGLCGNLDRCPDAAEPTNADADADGVGDACDACPGEADGPPDARFSAPEEVSRRTAAAVADLDGDGDLDVVTTTTDGRTAWLAQGPGGLGPEVALGGGATAVLPVDLDADGDLDLLLPDYPTEEVRLLENRGATFAERVLLSGVPALGTDAADLDGDGRLDLVVADIREDRTAWYRGGPGLAFAPGGVLRQGAVADRDELVRADDVDGDGDVDVLLGGRGSEALRLVENRGGGAFAEAAPLGEGTDETDALVLADLDGDGLRDLVTTHRTEGLVWWLRGQPGPGVARFGPPEVLDDTLSGPGGVSAADLDADGDVDLVVAAASNGAAWWFDGDGAGAFAAHPLAGGAGYRRTAAGDLDGNGTTDLVLVGERVHVAWSRLPADVDQDGICDAIDPHPTPDTGSTPTGPTATTGAHPPPSGRVDPERRCGCASPGPAGAPALLAALVLRRRRRPGPPGG